MSDLAEPGYVYALINPAMPGLVKVGRTTRRPAERAAELSGATGVPTPFELAYDVLVPDCAAGERFVHRALTERGYRLTDNREFFRAPLREVVGLLVGLRELMPAGAMTPAILGAPYGADPDRHDSDATERDKLFYEAAEACIQQQGGSTSLLQRRLKIGYDRAARIIDQLHLAGVLGPPDGSKLRDVLVGIEDLHRLGQAEPDAPPSAPDPPRISRWGALFGR